jgi:hypothetical protein
MGKTLYEPQSHRLIDKTEDDRDRCGERLDGRCSGPRRCEDQVRLQCYDLSRKCRQTCEIAVRISALDDQILPLDVTELCEFAEERFAREFVVVFARTRLEYAEPHRFRRSLRER